MEIARFKVSKAGTLKSVMLFMEGNPTFDLPEPKEIKDGDVLILELQPGPVHKEGPVPEEPLPEPEEPEELE